MRKRSEVKTSAVERTVPMFSEDPKVFADPQEVMDLKNGEPPAHECEACGERLTRTYQGWVYPCGHQNGANPSDNPRPKEGQTGPAVIRVEGTCSETVTVTWGEEKFTPVSNSYSTFSVGPFSVTATLKPGETREQKIKELLTELHHIAVQERTVKSMSFMEALVGMRKRATGE